MTKAAIKKAIADRKSFDTAHKHTRLWEACQRRLLPFQRKEDRMNAKWGRKALPRLVSETTSAKWAITEDNLWRALDAADEPNADVSQVEADLDACVKSAMRGLDFLDAEAHERHPNGVKPPESFEWDQDGLRFVVVADALGAAFLPDGVRVVTMREVAEAIKFYEKVVTFEAKAKEHFPEAKLKNAPVADVPEDVIEF